MSHISGIASRQSGGWVLGHHDKAQVRRRGLHRTGDVDRWGFVLLGKQTSIAMRYGAVGEGGEIWTSPNLASR